jgi:hypothetical protein
MIESLFAHLVDGFDPNETRWMPWEEHALARSGLSRERSSPCGRVSAATSINSPRDTVREPSLRSRGLGVDETDEAAAHGSAPRCPRVRDR